SGEKSRYIMQIENELAKLNENIEVENYVLQTDIGVQKHDPVTIFKDDTIISKLKEIERFSATSLTSYINCTLQFYFRYVANLKEDESIDDVFSGSAFGSIFHEIAEKLYKKYEGKTITVSELDKIADSLNNDFDKIWNS